MPEWAVCVSTLSGTMVPRADGGTTFSLPQLDTSCAQNCDLGVHAMFVVLSGPCTTSMGGRCVGRPDGYFSNEDCAIQNIGPTDVLGPCPVFDTSGSTGYIGSIMCDYMYIEIGDQGAHSGLA